MNNYVPYHMHTYYSMLDSVTPPEAYAKRASECGMKALGYSEHGNIFNWLEKKKCCDQYGRKYLHGIECYITEQLDPKVRDNMHTILIAKNMEGFKEINNLYFISTHPDHVYYKPRLSIEEFLNISDNVIKISACIQSPLWKLKDKPEIMDKLLRHYDYYEIQYHQFEDQKEFNKLLWEYSKQYDKPLIAGTDTHSLDKYKAECRTILQYGKTQGAWGDSENECDLTFKTYDELVEAFMDQNVLPKDVILEAIENTNVMADSCEDLVFDTHDKYPFLYGDKDEEVLWDVIYKNYQDKLSRGVIPDNKEYLDRINEEMAVFKKVNMIGFMLFMSEMMTWARDKHIATGFSRGSVSGSMVAYITNITDVDPIRWNTIFSRFCNEHRVEAGDIDTDWYEEDRGKIYDYIINRFGTQKTSYILALGTLADKSAIDVICKALKTKKLNSDYGLEQAKEIKHEYDKDPEHAKEMYPEVFYYFDGIKDCVVSQSQHPAGIVAAPMNLIDACGMFLGSDGQQILPLDMEYCHALGLIKYDILGLKTIGVIDKVCKMIGKYFPKADEINFTDKAVYDDMNENPATIFQFESQYAGDCFKKMGCRSIEDITLVNAAMRPGGASYRDKLFNHEVHDNGSELINDVLKESYGYIAFQEEVTAFLQYVCGFSGSDADSIRRAIGKKDKVKIEAAMPKILEGYCEKSDKPREIAEEEAKNFLQVIEDASSYMFNKNHALGYSLLTYLCGYYRHYYPVEYCTAYLICAKNDDDFNNGRALANSLGIKIADIKFRHALWDYSCDPKTRTIYKGLFGVKFVNKVAADNLYEMKDMEFEDFPELLDYTVNHQINARQLETLIKLNFFEEFGPIGLLLKILARFRKYRDRKHRLDVLRKDVKGFKKYKPQPYEEIDYEYEATEQISKVYPDMEKSAYYVVGKENRLGYLYQLCSGKIFKIKFTKKELFDKGMLVKILSVKQDNKWYKDDLGKWRQKPNEYEPIISEFSVLNGKQVEN